tara:strand:- start:4949 stop:6079 length:1131 start_codon:yes stop_codon:yes gene_type:complete
MNLKICLVPLFILISQNVSLATEPLVSDQLPDFERPPVQPSQTTTTGNSSPEGNIEILGEESTPTSEDSAPLKIPRFEALSSIDTRWRYQTNASDETTHNRVQYRWRTRTKVNLDREGCLQLGARISTGNEFDSAWENSSIDNDGSDAHLDIDVRSFYLKLDCLSENQKLELGFLDSKSEGELGLHGDGWIDGLRYTYVFDGENTIKLTLAAGQVDDFENVGFYERDLSGANYYQMTVVGGIGDDIEYLAEAVEYEDTTIFRGGLEWAVSEHIKLIDTIAYEKVYADDKDLADLVTVRKQVQQFKLGLGYSEVEDLGDEEGINLYPRETFFGRGENYFAIVEFPVKEQGKVRFRARNSSSDDEGYRVELGISWKLR